MATQERAPFEGMLAELVPIQGHNGDTIYGYEARPLGPGPYPGVVVIHHAPGWDEETKEITRKFAAHGYTAICPNLYYREGPSNPEEAAATVRAAGGTPDDRCMGDLQGAILHLRSMLTNNGKVGIIGYCSGGRQTYLSACSLSGLDAAVDCYGGRVIPAPDQLNERQPVAPIDLTANLSCPLLGLFGAEDLSPSPEEVAKTEEVLKQHGKTYEFHTYQDAGHSFFSVDRPSYRQEAAMDGWQRVFEWYEKYLSA